MGNCLQRRRPCVVSSVAAIRERLENLTYSKWSEFAEDLMLGYGNLPLKFSVELELGITFRSGDAITMTHIIGFDDYVLWNNLNYTLKQLTTFMQAPYYYIDDRLHFYANVTICKIVVIKRFVIVK
jgi:hypothetical protein